MTLSAAQINVIERMPAGHYLASSFKSLKTVQKLRKYKLIEWSGEEFILTDLGKELQWKSLK